MKANTPSHSYQRLLKSAEVSLRLPRSIPYFHFSVLKLIRGLFYAACPKLFKQKNEIALLNAELEVVKKERDLLKEILNNTNHFHAKESTYLKGTRLEDSHKRMDSEEGFDWCI